MNNKNHNQNNKIQSQVNKKGKLNEYNKKQKQSIYRNKNNSHKKLIESYNTKYHKFQFHLKKKINLETSTTFDKNNNNNLSLFSFLSEDKTTNKSLKTTKETESNHINKTNKIFFYNNKKNKFIFKSQKNIKTKTKNMKSTINKKYIKINNNDYNINKELDNFKHRINNLLIIIENFENEYINSEQPKIIKEKLEQIIKNKKYFSYNCNNNYSALKLQKKNQKV